MLLTGLRGVGKTVLLNEIEYQARETEHYQTIFVEAHIPRLDQNFFRVRFDRLIPSEKNYLRAMAELGPGPYSTGEVVNLLHTKSTTLAPIRAKLIKKGMIYSPAHGELAFTVPLFDQFMKRAIPHLQ